MKARRRIVSAWSLGVLCQLDWDSGAAARVLMRTIYQRNRRWGLS